MSTSTKSQTVRGRGRPEKFTSGVVQQFKNIVRRHGLIAGREFINNNGVKVGGKQLTLSVSLPTLAKYVKRDAQGGKPVALKRGRPRKEVTVQAQAQVA
jgi:hypothetical protein